MVLLGVGVAAGDEFFDHGYDLRQMLRHQRLVIGPCDAERIEILQTATPLH